jgi:hypothetical protein
MNQLPQFKLQMEREFLYEVGTSLNSALLIVDRLVEEIKEEQGRLEVDLETEKLFLHLSNYLESVNHLVKVRSNLIAEILDEEMRLEREKKLAQMQPIKKKTAGRPSLRKHQSSR